MTLTLEDLVAREEIGDVVKRLARGTDRLDEELIASCYHSDGTDDHNVFRGTGTEFARWVVETLPHFEATMHFVGSPLIRLDGDVAHVDTYCVAHHISRPDGDGQQTDMVLALRYVDRFERRAGDWRVAARGARSTGRPRSRSTRPPASGSRRAGSSAPATGPTPPLPGARGQAGASRRTAASRSDA